MPDSQARLRARSAYLGGRVFGFGISFGNLVRGNWRHRRSVRHGQQREKRDTRTHGDVCVSLLALMLVRIICRDEPNSIRSRFD